MKTERQIKCEKCSGTGLVRVDIAAMSTSGQSWGTCNPEETRICPACDGEGIVVEITEVVITYRKIGGIK